ncbi:MAG: NADH-quinone oxidoreductase subunit K [Ignavibacteria bacterium]|nr:NADH-quinone oxidoreductase subunit K [Ignavibacteria bacterium]
MLIFITILSGVIFAVGIYMILRRSIVRLILGFALISNAVNLLLFISGKLVKGRPPIIPENLNSLSEIHSDPIPQALILTAIVIGFGLIAFSTILIKRAYIINKTEDLDDLNTTDKIIVKSSKEK